MNLEPSTEESQNDVHINQEESQPQSQYESISDMESQYQTQTQTQSQPLSSKGKHKIPQMYGVYLLNSLSKKTCYYVGSTPDPIRRLRQHNGELTHGGAYRTKKKGYRPWRMVLYVYGFPSKISALQFEHAWQHAYQTRHIPFERRLNPGKKSTGSGTTLHSKVANCRLLLQSEGFNRLGLKVAIFNNTVYDVWLKNRFGIIVPEDLTIDVRLSTEDLDESVIMGGNYNQLKHFVDTNVKFQEAYFEKISKIYEDIEQPKVCQICKKEVTIQNSLNAMCICTFGDCACIYHLDCLANKFINDEGIDNGELLPKRGKCVGCNKVNFWNLAIRGTTYLQQKYGDNLA